jgi:Carbohydrate-binding family 9
MEYIVRRAAQKPELQGNWDGEAWNGANLMVIANAQPKSSDHRPHTEAKFLFDDATVYGIYKVRDQYVRAIAEKFQDSVCRDSCVEAFIQAKGESYINFEFSCNGTLLCQHVVDCTRGPKGFADARLVTPEDGASVGVYHSLSGRIDPEITEPTEWILEFAIPVALFENYVGEIGSPAGQTWRANFYKCADDTSHPHWLSWAPVGELNFHRPQDFQAVKFEA